MNNNHLVLFNRNNQKGYTKPKAPFLSDKEIAPFLEEIVSDAVDTGVHLSYSYEPNSSFSTYAEQLFEYFERHKIYYDNDDYELVSFVHFILPRRKLDEKFQKICTCYQSPLSSRSSCQIS